MVKKKSIKTKEVIFALVLVLVCILLFFVQYIDTNSFEKRSIKDSIQFNLPNNVDYSKLETDPIDKNTFGIINKYSVSSSIEDGYFQITKKYGTIEKAKDKIENDDKKITLDGYLFTNYLLSYLGGVSKNIGIPNSEETITLDNGDWIHYYDFPTLENGDSFEVYITWNNGIFYYIEVAYKDEFNKEIANLISTAKLNDEKGIIPK